MPQKSPEAAKRLTAHIDGAGTGSIDDLMGQTDCDDGCVVEPDGECPHGYESAAVTANLI